MLHTNNAKIERIKGYFTQIESLDKRIKVIEEERVKLRVLSVRVGGATEIREVQSSPKNSDKIGELVSTLCDLEIDYVNLINKLINRKKDTITKINTLTDDRWRLVLELKYLNYLKWEEIAEKLDYSSRQVRRYHDKAINEFATHFNADEWILL